MRFVGTREKAGKSLPSVRLLPASWEFPLAFNQNWAAGAERTGIVVVVAVGDLPFICGRRCQLFRLRNTSPAAVL